MVQALVTADDLILALEEVAIMLLVARAATMLLAAEAEIMEAHVSKVSRSVKVEGTKAYVAQSPWIQSGKIEDNILFRKEMDRERYDMVLEACSLKKDLEIFSFCDQTVIGERGINLSGGQKQRGYRLLGLLSRC
ncbi:ABC transporter C family member 3-like protein [Tanacetum coccineum]